MHVFSIYFAINLFFAIYLTWKHKQTMEQRPHRAYEQAKSKQKQSQVTIFYGNYFLRFCNIFAGEISSCE